jgi:prepilin-type N-terminal cleavage/methylation domain-containing protein
VKLSETGLTLIEVMVAMIIFSSAIGMVTNIVIKGVERPFAVYGAEPWLYLVEASNREILNLPAGFESSMITVTTPPLNQVQKPPDLRSWELNWQMSDDTGIRVATFSATSFLGKSFQWRIYRASDE